MGLQGKSQNVCFVEVWLRIGINYFSFVVIEEEFGDRPWLNAILWILL
jgi:hypothetical protein